MPAPWQKWMPLHIEKLWSSPSVQRMSGNAFKGYMSLITAQWQSEDCSLTCNVEELAEISRLSDAEWAESSASILRKFPSTELGRLRNQACYELWMDAKARYAESQINYEFLRERRAKSGKAGAEARWQKYGKRMANDSKPMANACGSDSKPMAKDGLINTYTATNTKAKKPSGDKRQPDERHTPFRLEIQATYENQEYGEFAWDASEAKALSNLLGANPKLTLDGFRRLMSHRARSEAVNLAQRPRAWLERITDYANGPLDRFNKPKGDMHGAQPSSNRVGGTTSPTSQRVESGVSAFRRAAIDFGATDGVYGANGGEIPEPRYGGSSAELPLRLQPPSPDTRTISGQDGNVKPTHKTGPEILSKPGRDSRGTGVYGR